MNARQTEIVLPRVKMRNPLLLFRIVRMNRHIVQFQVRPRGTGQNLRFKIVSPRQKVQTGDVAHRIRPEAALAVPDLHSGFDPHPEVRKLPSEAAGGRNVRHGKVPAADQKRVVVACHQRVETGDVFRIVLAVGVQRDHVSDRRIGTEVVQRGENRRPLAEIALVTEDGNSAPGEAFRQIPVGGAVVDHQHIRENAPGARNNVKHRRGVVVDRYHAPDATEIGHASSPPALIRRSLA